eukprot:TRINITY_DN108189_c0_g1_i1.p2 TRINITY_DN108189_c0_g1~~TRINITY_DN108189_c0_g1_i1.p2  ORF type:complete len:119 (-),score=11.63 TRINITY_DN108189_c0_g1_i1:177-533(-)
MQKRGLGSGLFWAEELGASMAHPSPPSCSSPGEPTLLHAAQTVTQQVHKHTHTSDQCCKNCSKMRERKANACVGISSHTNCNIHTQQSTRESNTKDCANPPEWYAKGSFHVWSSFLQQ